MKGHILSLLEQARLAFDDLTSAADQTMNRLQSVDPEADLQILRRRVSNAKAHGMSALDKIDNLLNATDDL